MPLATIRNVNVLDKSSMAHQRFVMRDAKYYQYLILLKRPRQIPDFALVDALKKVYNAIMQPHFDYCHIGVG